MRKHQLKLAGRQCRMAELSQRVQDTVVLLVTALWAHQAKTPTTIMAADVMCQDLRCKLRGARPGVVRYQQDTSLVTEHFWRKRNLDRAACLNWLWHGYLAARRR